VKVGTILESSNLPMHKWLQAIFLASGERGPMDASQLQHALNVAPRTASYVLQRMRMPGSARLDELPGKIITKPG
jgi:Mn-dependent DtxR family transcriptional regulator